MVCDLFLLRIMTVSFMILKVFCLPFSKLIKGFGASCLSFVANKRQGLLLGS